MITFLTILIALVCLLLMLAVLIQNPKGGLDSTFGGSTGAQVFGVARSTSLIEKMTWGLTVALFALCIITAVLVNSGS